MTDRYEEEIKRIEEYFKSKESYNQKQLKSFIDYLNKTDKIVSEADDCFGYKEEPILIDPKSIRVLESVFVMYMKSHIELYVTLCQRLFQHNPEYLRRIMRIIGKDALDSLIAKGIYIERLDEETGKTILILKKEYEEFYKGLEDE